ncbi:MAG: helix-turn-helix domain-containing protein [Actinomycetota bacterium]|nr:helix-turn-helix domain-containing protein [Actinomycetota bacterium]
MREGAGELEQLILDRICALEEEAGHQGHERLHGLRKVIRPALEYGFAAIEQGERHRPPPPPEVLAHARNAAWSSVDLKRLVRRYQTSHMVFATYLLKEGAGGGGHPKGSALCEVAQSHTLAFEHLLDAFEEEFQRENEKRTCSPEARRLERVKGLLSAELQEAPDLSYDFSKHHIGLVGSGEGAAEAARALAREFEGELLLVQPSPGRVWAWIGNLAVKPVAAAGPLLRSELPPTGRLALGEPSSGLEGWRMSHQQAEAAFAVAAPGKRNLVLYADVAVVAPRADNDVLESFLYERYLAPLEKGSDDGKILRDTLKAYFAAGWNGEAAGRVLGVSRQTVKQRIEVVEARLGQSLPSGAFNLQAALFLKDLDECQVGAG